MSNITIGRYNADLGAPWSGWVEGADDADQSWIVFLDDTGRPALYWPERDSNGGVIGEPVRLLKP